MVVESKVKAFIGNFQNKFESNMTTQFSVELSCEKK